MNSIFTPSRTVVCLAVTALFMSGCKKDFVDIYKNYEKYHNSNKTYIKKVSVLTSDEVGVYVVDYNFTYNSIGNPVNVKNNAVSTGHPNTVFKYDRKNRMTEMIRSYDNGFYESWTKYVYNNRDQIVSDTQYIFGSYQDSIPLADPENGFWTTHYKYDNYDRITTKIDSTFFMDYGSGQTYTYQYDAKGNLIAAGATYDEGTNFAALNKVWQFVCNSYCVNNNFKATSYNKDGLPLTFTGTVNAMTQVITVAGNFTMTYGQR